MAIFHRSRAHFYRGTLKQYPWIDTLINVGGGPTLGTL